MIDVERMRASFDAWNSGSSSGYIQLKNDLLNNVPAILDMADRLTRYEAALRKYGQEFCELGEYHDACGRMSDIDCSGCAARKALGDGK